MKKIISSLLAFALLVTVLSGMSVTASAATNLSASEDVIGLIKSFEGFHNTAYWDNSQWSIGYGTVSSQGATITQEEADAALREEVAEIQEDLNAFMAQNGVNLNQYQYDALVSLSFNCGTKWMNSNGRLRQAVIGGKTGNDFLFAISLWANINSVPNPGLLKRRMSEANLYLNGEYSKNPPSNYTYVILNPNGGTPGHGSEDKMQGYNSGGTVSIMADNPSKSGYSFGGWFTSTSGGDCVTELSSATAGKTLYARWGVKVKVTGSYANVRSDAGASNAQVGTVNNGDTLVIVETAKVDGALWGRFDRGWVALEYTDYSGDGEMKGEETIATGTVKCTTSVNLRSGAGTNYTVCGSVTNGTKVKIYEEKTVSGYKWGRIDGGWIRLDYVTLDSSPSSSGSSGMWGDGSSSDSTGKTGVVTGRGVNVRKAAGTGNPVVGSVTKGDKVTVYEQTTVGNTPWGRIGENKWVCMNYVKLDDDDNDSDSSSESGKSGTVTATTLNVRSGAGIGYTRVGTLAKGTKVTVYETKTVSGTKWGRIGTNRWVSLSYVSQDGSSGSIWDNGSGSSDSSGSASTSDSNTGTVTATSLNVRSAPGTGYAKAGSLNKGDKVTILETKTVGSVKWGRIGTNRWICLSYVDFGSGSTSSGSSSMWGENGNESSGSTETGTAGTVTATSLNVRSGAGIGYTRVGTLAKGTKVTVYETKTVGSVKWGRIGTNRWVSLDYVSKSGSSDDKVIASGTVSTTSGGLNVRSGAGTNYTRVGSLASGTKIDIYEEKTVGSTKWGRTDKGWVCMDYVSVNGSGSSLWN